MRRQDLARLGVATEHRRPQTHCTGTPRQCPRRRSQNESSVRSSRQQWDMGFFGNSGLPAQVFGTIQTSATGGMAQYAPTTYLGLNIRNKSIGSVTTKEPHLPDRLPSAKPPPCEVGHCSTCSAPDVLELLRGVQERASRSWHKPTLLEALASG